MRAQTNRLRVLLAEPVGLGVLALQDGLDALPLQPLRDGLDVLNP